MDRKTKAIHAECARIREKAASVRFERQTKRKGSTRGKRNGR